jgi:hypothetical protein
MALKQKAVLLHHAVNPLVVWRRTALGQGCPAQDRMHPAIAVGGQVGDHGRDLCHEVVGRCGRTPNPPARTALDLLDEVRASDPDHVGHGFHREPL